MTNKLPKPYFYQSSWYITENDQRIRICGGTDDERKAWKKGKRAKHFKPTEAVNKALIDYLSLASVDTTRESTPVKVIAELYLQAVEQEAPPKTFKLYRRRLQNLCDQVGNKTVDQLKPSDINRWVRANPQWKSANTVARSILLAKTMFNWAIKNDYLDKSPIASVQPPKTIRREYLITDEDERTIKQRCNKSFVQFFTMLLLTGARPGEIARVTASDIIRSSNGTMIRLKEHKNAKKTGKRRTIYLCDVARSIVEQLAAQHQNGPLFRQQNDGKWHDGQWGRELNRLAEAGLIPDELDLYSTRHTFITRSLERGLSIEIVATLVGNTPAVLHKHYNHLSQNAGLMFDAVQRTNQTELKLAAS